MSRSPDQPPTLLVIDDEPIVRESIASYLEDSGYVIHQAGDGQSGLEIFRRLGPDLLLVDLRMPRIDGLEVLSTVGRESAETPVVVVSGTGVIQDAIEALRNGAWDFVTKPIQDMAVLEHTIEKALERARLLTENRKYRERLESEYKNAEDSLRRNKERLSLALEATDHAIWDWDLTTNSAYFSSRYYTLLGFEPSEKPESLDQWKSLLHDEDREATLAALADYLAGRSQTYETEFRMATRDGQWRWILGRGKIVEWDDKGQPLRMIGTHLDITGRKLQEEALRLSEANLRGENLRLKSTLKGSTHFGDIVGRSRAIQTVYETILKAATTRATVIVTGESGTGKELVARTIHSLSDRGHRPFVAVNCGAVPEHLMESEFFGYCKGAFTGADKDRPGYLESAQGGTVFLDEVAELDVNMQVKLLRVIDGGGYCPIGSRSTRYPDVRFIAATNRNLKEMVEQGRIREDFYYRIHIVPISIPPLRERKADLPLLIRHFLDRFCQDGKILSIPKDLMEEMQSHDWPGNVRELQNAVHQFVTLKEVDFLDVPPGRAFDAESEARELIRQGKGGPDLKGVAAAVEKKYILTLLEEYRWHRGRVANRLGINRRTLNRKMKTYEIS